MPSDTQDSSKSQFILRARVVLPVRRAPIENGAVVIAANRIVSVGRWHSVRRRFSAPVLDLGETILMPGLVNAHCHLDYTDMTGLFPPTRKFCDWIKLITTEKATWGYSDFANSWLNGARMLLQSGTTTVGDIEAVPELLPEVWDATPMRILSFIEMTGVRSRRDPKTILGGAIKVIESLSNTRCVAGLSPHAPYSTMPPLLEATAAVARRRRWRIATHLAESAAEFEMFRHARGEMFDWLKRNERSMDDCGHQSPVQHAAKAKLLGPNFIAVHVNYLADGDAELLARKKASVVHCPRSHDYFRHDPFPRRQLARAGVNICLGTDSLATVHKSRRQQVELNMFDELRAFAENHSGVSPRQIIRMATLNGAKALGLGGKVGELTRGAFADVIALPFDGRASACHGAVVAHTGPVFASMIDGQWTIAPEVA